MAWLYLFLAGLCEIGWPLGLKLSQTTALKIPWIVFAAVAISTSGYFLLLAQKSIPIGTAYAIWTGIGAFGTFLIGIFFFKDAISLTRIASVMLIVAGIVGLKLSHG